MTTVYVVDDDPLVTHSLGTALRLETDYDVCTFQAAAEALAALPGQPPDVVVSDIKMPGTDGLGLMRQIRRALPDAVLILLTGYSDKESAVSAINEVGIFQYVEKPWDLQDLLLKIRAGIDRQRLQRELEASHQALAARAGELQDKNDELVRAGAELQRAHERLIATERLAAVGRVVSGLAHELGNQLALVGYAEAIKVRTTQPEVRELAEVIASAQKRLAAMVGEIRDFVRGHGSPPRLEPADVATVIEEALGILRWDPELAGHRIVREVVRRPLARLHAGKFSQVVINLVRNAAQASPPRADVVVRLDEEGGRVELVVADRGAGMSPDVLSRLGEPFFTTRGDKGTGLGVGISRRIVEEHGGEMVFHSTPGEGTRVTVRFPALGGP